MSKIMRKRIKISKMAPNNTIEIYAEIKNISIFNLPLLNERILNRASNMNSKKKKTTFKISFKLAKNKRKISKYPAILIQNAQKIMSLNKAIHLTSISYPLTTTMTTGRMIIATRTFTAAASATATATRTDHCFCYYYCYCYEDVHCFCYCSVKEDNLREDVHCFYCSVKPRE